MVSQCLRSRVEFGYGFDSPRNLVSAERPDDPLYRAFEKWLDNTPDPDADGKDFDYKKRDKVYKSALDAVEPLGIENLSLREINGLVKAYAGHQNIRLAGFFLSACYSLIGIDDIVFDTNSDSVIGYLGYRLPKGKRLVLPSGSYYDVCLKAEGDAINYGSINGFHHGGKGGIVINYGKALGLISSRATGIFINMGEVENIGHGASGISMSFRHNGRRSKYLGIDVSGKRWGSVSKLNASKEHFDKFPKLNEYFERFESVLEVFRGAKFPDCLGAIDFVRNEVVEKEEFTDRVLGFTE